MTDQCLAITLVTGDTPEDRKAEIVASLNGNRPVSATTSPIENGDVMFVADLSDLQLIASNVLLTADMQAPVFRAIDVANV